MIFDDFLNFAYGTVVSPPSPASSGTTFSLSAASWPAPPFQLVVWPSGVRPLASNAEIITVTAITGGSVTASLRAQEGSSAKAVIGGWQASAAVTAGVLRNLRKQAAPDRLVIGRDTAAKITNPNDSTQVAAALTEAFSQSSYHPYLPRGDYQIPASLQLATQVAGQLFLGAGKKWTRLVPDAPVGRPVGAIFSCAHDSTGLRDLAIGRGGGWSRAITGTFTVGVSTTLVHSAAGTWGFTPGAGAGRIALEGDQNKPPAIIDYTAYDSATRTFSGLTVVRGLTGSAFTDSVWIVPTQGQDVAITGEAADVELESFELNYGFTGLANVAGSKLKAMFCDITDHADSGLYMAPNLAHPDLGNNQITSFSIASSFARYGILWRGGGGWKYTVGKVNKCEVAVKLDNRQQAAPGGGVTTNQHFVSFGLENPMGTAAANNAVELGAPSGTADADTLRNIVFDACKFLANNRTDIPTTMIFCDKFANNKVVANSMFSGPGSGGTVGIVVVDGDGLVISGNSFYQVQTPWRVTAAAPSHVRVGINDYNAGVLTSLVMADHNTGQGQNHDILGRVASKLQAVPNAGANAYEVQMRANAMERFTVMVEAVDDLNARVNYRAGVVIDHGSTGAACTVTLDGGAATVVGTAGLTVTYDVSVVDQVTIILAAAAGRTLTGLARLHWEGLPKKVTAFNGANVKL